MKVGHAPARTARPQKRQTQGVVPTREPVRQKATEVVLHAQLLLPAICRRTLRTAGAMAEMGRRIRVESKTEREKRWWMDRWLGHG